MDTVDPVLNTCATPLSGQQLPSRPDRFDDGSSPITIERKW